MPNAASNNLGLVLRIFPCECPCKADPPHRMYLAPIRCTLRGSSGVITLRRSLSYLLMSLIQIIMREFHVELSGCVRMSVHQAVLTVLSHWASCYKLCRTARRALLARMAFPTKPCGSTSPGGSPVSSTSLEWFSVWAASPQYGNKKLSCRSRRRDRVRQLLTIVQLL